MALQMMSCINREYDADCSCSREGSKKAPAFTEAYCMMTLYLLNGMLLRDEGDTAVGLSGCSGCCFIRFTLFFFGIGRIGALQS